MLAILRDDARWPGCALVMTWVLVSTPGATQPVLSRLRPPTAVLAEGFGRITGVRELSDGRLLVSDGLDKRIVVTDFATQRVTQIGRQGDGPGEYASGGVPNPLGGDTTIFSDALARRWTLVVGDRVVMTVPPDHPAVLATQGTMYGSDRIGHVLGMRIEPRRPGVQEIGAADSGNVVLVSFATGRSDTVARVGRPRVTYTGWDDVGGRPFYFTSRTAFSTGETFDLADDGWLAIARLDPYRVDWRTPDGRMIRGAPIPYDVVKVTARERAFYLQRYARSANTPPNLPAALTPVQRAAAIAGFQRQWTDFPATIPPFEPPGITAMSADAAFIRRMVTADAPDPVFDVVDRRGRLIARLQLAKGERIIGAGRGCIYVAVEDEDGLDHLRRHPWP